MNYSITGYLAKYYGCMMSKENITLDEAFDIAWSNAQKGLYSVIESDTHAIYRLWFVWWVYHGYIRPYEGVKNRGGVTMGGSIALLVVVTGLYFAL